MGGRASSERHDAELAEEFFSKYRLGRQIGKGAFGQVFEVKPKSDLQTIGAAKVTQKDGDPQEFWSDVAVFNREVAMLKSLEHENILTFWDSFADQTSLYLVTELCAGGQVFEQLTRRQRFLEIDAAAIATEMLLAIKYVHGKFIMHRDIKAENFMFSEPSLDSAVKMIDFGMSSWFEEGEMFHEVCGSRFSYAPEMLERKYDYRIDMWAFGVLMYLLCCGRYPFNATNKKKLTLADLNRRLVWKQNVSLSPETKDFIQSILQPNPDERLTAEEALTHPFIGYLEENVSEISHVSRASLNSSLSESVKQALDVVRTTGNVTASAPLERMRGPRLAAKSFAQRASELVHKPLSRHKEETAYSRDGGSSTKITAGAWRASATHAGSPKSSTGHKSSDLGPVIASKERAQKATSSENGLGAEVGSWDRQVYAKDASTGHSMFPEPTPLVQKVALPENGAGTAVRSLGLGTEVGRPSRRASKGSGGVQKAALPENGLGTEVSSWGHGKEAGSSGRWVSKGSDGSSHSATKDSSMGHSTLSQPTPSPTMASSSSDGQRTTTAQGSFHGRPPPTPRRSSSFEHDSTLPARKPRNLTPLDLMPLMPSRRSARD